MAEAKECPPETILAGVHRLQKKALAGYNAVLDNTVTEEKWKEALAPKHVAISLSGEPTLYSRLPELADLFNANGYTTFVVRTARTRTCSQNAGRSSSTSRSMHLTETYERPACRWATRTGTGAGYRRALPNYQQNARRCGSRLSPGTTTQSRRATPGSSRTQGHTFVEVKGYMYLGYSRNRLQRNNMPEHAQVRKFAERITASCDYKIRDENPLSRVICLEREET